MKARFKRILQTYVLVDLLVLALLASTDLSLEIVMQIRQVIEKLFLIAVRVSVRSLLISTCIL
jgi:hypothetical protein